MPATAATPTPPAVQPVRLNFADHAEALRLTVGKALDQARALRDGWTLEADDNSAADREADETLRRLVAELRDADRTAANVERLVRAATAEETSPDA